MHCQDTVRIPLRARDGSVRAYAIVDAADATFVNQWRWSLHSRGYACRNAGGGGIILLHRAILGLIRGDGLEGDHISRDRLDCRRSNMRILAKGLNSQNISSKGKTSNYRGVSWSARDRVWRAQIKKDGKNTYLGSFSNERDAAEVARAARAACQPYATD